MIENRLNQIEAQLRRYVSENPFNNMAVAQAFLDHHKVSGQKDVLASYETWMPDSLAILYVYGGTNCVGATYEFLANRALIEGLTFRQVISTDENLPEGVTRQEVPHQHLALFAIDDESGDIFLVDPGLGLVKPVGIHADETEFGGRKYSLVQVDDDKNRLSIIKPNGSTLSIDFAFLPDNVDPEEVLQKPLLRATKEFKIDAFSPDGHKTASLKVDIYNNMVSCFIHGHVFSYPFDELDLLFKHEMFNSLSDAVMKEADQLQDVIKTLVAKRQTIIDLWYEGLQREYYLRHSELLSPFESGWDALEKKEYRGGGVVVMLINENDEVLLYKVPEGKGKPHIGRHVGQLNFFTETADPQVENGTVADLEPFLPNLARAFSEEIGLEVPDLDTMTYRETDYGRNFRARCAIFRVDSSYIDEVRSAKGTHDYELGDVEWVPMNDLDGYWIDPSAEIILKKVRDDLYPTSEVSQ